MPQRLLVTRRLIVVCFIFSHQRMTSCLDLLVVHDGLWLIVVCFFSSLSFVLVFKRSFLFGLELGCHDLCHLGLSCLDLSRFDLWRFNLSTFGIFCCRFEFPHLSFVVRCRRVTRCIDLLPSTSGTLTRTPSVGDCCILLSLDLLCLGLQWLDLRRLDLL